MARPSAFASTDSVSALKHELRSRLGAESVALVDLPQMTLREADLFETIACAADTQGRYVTRTSVLAGVPIAACELASADARDPRELVLADFGEASSAICDPCRKGADICVEYLGALDPMWSMCAVVGVRKGLGEVGETIIAAFSDMEAQDGMLAENILEGLADADARQRAACDAARVLAEYLRCHPRVRAIYYPGLPDDPSHATARRTLHHGFGPVVDAVVEGEGVSRSGLEQLSACGVELTKAQVSPANRDTVHTEDPLRFRVGAPTDAFGAVSAIESLLAD